MSGPSLPLGERRAEARFVLLVALACAATSFFLGTRHNDFPFRYHPDEPGKVRQVMRGEWNFHHPLLLLSSTKVVAGADGAATGQEIARVGRTLSALFIAVSVAAMILVAYAWSGVAAAIATGLLLCVHHQLFELAHYMKEDAALLMGVTLSILAGFRVWQNASAARIAFFGFACALALSAKYVGGLFAAALALPLLSGAPLAAGQPRVWSRFAIFLGVLAPVVVLINFPILAQWATFESSLDREVGLVVKGHGGLTRRVPHSEYLSLFVDNTTPVIWVLLGFYVWCWWQRRRATPWPQTILTLLPFAYLLVLSFSPKSNDRYFLPATALLHLLAAIGAVEAARWCTRKLPAVSRLRAPGLVLGLILLPAVGWEGVRLLRYDRAFRHDDRAELADWIRQHIPPTSVVAQDGRVKLQEVLAGVATPHQVLGRKLAADLGSLEQLRGQGVTHVVVSQSDYGGFFRKTHTAQRGGEEAFLRQKEWYERLFAEGELVWERPRGTVIYLHPGLRVYRLR